MNNRTRAVALLVLAASIVGCSSIGSTPSQIAETSTPTPSQLSASWKSDAARLYLAAATAINDEWTAWAADTQSMAAAANASEGNAEEKDRVFYAAWMPRNHAFGEAFRSFASAIRGLPVPPEAGIDSVESLAVGADWLADYLAQFDDGDQFVASMGTLDSWLVHWYDATGAAQNTASKLRAALGLPSTEEGF